MTQVPPFWQGPGFWLHSFTSCLQVGPWKLGGQPQMYEASKGRHWPPLAQGLEAHGSACWHIFPDQPGGQRHLYSVSVSRSQVPPLRQGLARQALSRGVRQRGPEKPRRQLQV